MELVNSLVIDPLKKIGKFVIVPGVGVGTYFLIKNDKKLSTGAKIGIVAGSTLLAFLVQNTVTNLKRKSNRANPNLENIPVIGYDPGGNPITWNADPISQEIANNIEGGNFMTYPETAQKILDLNNDQTKVLYNHYNEYYATDYPTLTKLFANEWSDWEGKYKKVTTKLQSLGLEERGRSTHRSKRRR